MRELNTTELQEVSGAGKIADAAASLGSSIGALMENFGVKGAKEAATSIGNNIGAIVETSIDFFNTIFGGIFGRK